MVCFAKRKHDFLCCLNQKWIFKMTEVNTTLHGFALPGYEQVAEVFANNFLQCGELGAAVNVVRDGETVVNLWAGTRDKGQLLPWEEATVVNIFSAGKPMVAVAALQLVAKGLLDLDSPIADYWPEFSGADKHRVTLRQVLCHRSGVNAFREKIKDKDIFQWQTMISHLESEAPWWLPGSAQGYSPMIYGWLIGELVRRVAAAESFADYFEQTIAEPLALQSAVGCPESLIDQVADVVVLKKTLPTAGNSDLVALMRSDPRGVANKAFSNPSSMMFGTNSSEWRSGQIPAANIHASASALAGFYGDLAMRDTNASRLLPDELREQCWMEQSRGVDRVLAAPLRFGLGFMLADDNPSSSRCGHPGSGGCYGFADRDHGIGFGYVTRAMGQSVLVDYRADQLAKAVYASVEA